MAGTITPVGHGGSRSRWAGSVFLHALGATSTAAAFGAALAAAGALAGAPWGGSGVWLVVAGGTAYAAREWLGAPVRIPERRRQVPERWRSRFPRPVSAFLYGAGLGVGFLTFVRHGTLLVVACAILAAGDPSFGAVALGAYGLARALSLTVAASARSDEGVSRLLARLERLGEGPAPRIANGGALVALALVAAVDLPGGDPAGLGAAVLGISLVWAALAKWARPRAWAAAIDAHRLGPPAATVRRLVPFLEAAVPLLLVLGARRAGGTLALTLIVTFTAAIVRATRGGREIPCGCFGRGARHGRGVLLARNASLTVAAVAVVAGPARLPGPAIAAPAGAEVAAAALAATGVAAGILVALRTRAWLRSG